METNFKLPDNKAKAGKVIGFGLLAAVGLITYSKLLPFLTSIMWGTTELLTAAGITALLAYILTSKKFWRRMKIILDTLGAAAFGWFIEMNRWKILDMQIEKAADDREKSKLAIDSLKGQEASLKAQLREQNDVMEQSLSKIQICKKKLALNPESEEDLLLAESSATDFANAKGFIESISPMYENIKRLCEFGDKAYRKSGNAIKNMRSTLNIRRASYDASIKGQTAMNKVLRAFTGDSELNNAAEKAAKSIEMEIANGLGTIKNSMMITSQFMSELDLNDAAKVERAVKQADNTNIDELEYQMVGSPIADLPASKAKGNPYLEYLKK